MKSSTYFFCLFLTFFIFKDLNCYWNCFLPNLAFSFFGPGNPGFLCHCAAAAVAALVASKRVSVLLYNLSSDFNSILSNFQAQLQRKSLIFVTLSWLSKKRLLKIVEKCYFWVNFDNFWRLKRSPDNRGSIIPPSNDVFCNVKSTKLS